MATPEATAAELSEGEWPARLNALDRLPTGEPVAAEFHAALVGLLSAPEAEQRAKAVAAVVCVGAPLVPLLVAMLDDESPNASDARRAAVVALGRIGPAARGSIARLRDLAGDPWLGSCARAALDAIEPPRARGFVLLGAVIAAATVTAVGLPSIGSGPVAGVLGVVAACVAFGVWWTRPGAAGAAWVFVAGVAVVTAGLVASGLPDVFGEAARALKRP